MMWDRKRFWIWVAIVFFVAGAFSFKIFGASYTQALIVAAAVAGIYILGRVLWRVLRLYKALEWIAWHSPFKSLPKSMVIIAIAFFLMVSLYVTTVLIIRHMSRPPDAPKLTYTEFVDKAAKGGIAKYVILKYDAQLLQQVTIVFFTDLTDGKPKWTYFANAPAYIPQVTPEEWLRLLEYNVEQKFPFPMTYLLMQILQGFIMSVPFFFFLWFIAGGGLRSIAGEFTTMTDARQKSEKGPSFDDIAGFKAEKEQAQEIIDYLKDPRDFEDFVARQPRGLLLGGPPGTGKSLFARAIAHRAGVPFYEVSGADFHQMFVGVGAAKADDLFKQAIWNQPSIIFIDEAEAIAISRDKVSPWESKERQSVVAKLLHLFDEISTKNHRVVVIFSTNYPELIDVALQRPGRFDKKIVTHSPSQEERTGIVRIHLTRPRPTPLAPELTLERVCQELSKYTPGFSGAALESFINEARLLARRKFKAGKRTQRVLLLEDFQDVLYSVTLGLPRDLIIPTARLERIGIHEAGHCYFSWLFPGATPAESLVLVPHGNTLGFTWHPEDEFLFKVEPDFLASIQVSLAGQIAEKAFYGNFSTMASFDLRNATDVAKGMVYRHGMSKLGLVSVEALTPSEFGSGGDGFTTAAKEEVARIIQSSADKLTKLLDEDPEHKKRIERLQQMALKSDRRTLDRPDIEEAIGATLEELRKSMP